MVVFCARVSIKHFKSIYKTTFLFSVESNTAFGVSDPTVFPDSHFSASSEYDYRYKASKARLNKPFGWAPATSNKDSAYLQIDLGTVRSIYAIATQGHGGYGGNGGADKEWVTSYKLALSLDQSVWEFYKEGSRVKVRLATSY